MRGGRLLGYSLLLSSSLVQGQWGEVAPKLDLRGGKGILTANGKQFHIKGINWFGSEAGNIPPGGLEFHDLEWYLDFLQKHNFNAIRLLFNHEDAWRNEIVHAPKEARAPGGFLFQVRYVEQFLVIAKAAAKRGIVILVGCHRINADAWFDNKVGFWYSDALGWPESRVMQSWTKIAQALCTQWNIIAVDLHNEPIESSWGRGMDSDWNAAAERIGNHVLKMCPRWLIFVQGVGYKREGTNGGAPGFDDPGEGYWDGGNLGGAEAAPVILSDQSKLVYSPHVYGPSVYEQSYFRANTFPMNMPEIWRRHWGVVQSLGTPVVIGEIGGNYMNLDKQWVNWAMPQCKKLGVGLFWFSMNPDSEDTNGIFEGVDAWAEPGPESPETGKLKAMQVLEATDVFSICDECFTLAQTEQGGEEGATEAESGPSAAVLLAPGILILLCAFFAMAKLGGVGGVMSLASGKVDSGFAPVAPAPVIDYGDEEANIPDEPEIKIVGMRKKNEKLEKKSLLSKGGPKSAASKDKGKVAPVAFGSSKSKPSEKEKASSSSKGKSSSGSKREEEKSSSARVSKSTPAKPASASKSSSSKTPDSKSKSSASKKDEPLAFGSSKSSSSKSKSSSSAKDNEPVSFGSSKSKSSSKAAESSKKSSSSKESSSRGKSSSKK